MRLRFSRHFGALIGLTLVYNLSIAHQPSVVVASKIDCYPIEGASKERCEALGCKWSPVEAQKSLDTTYPEPTFEQETVKLIENGMTPSSNVQEPWCHFPEDYVGYRIISRQGSTIRLTRTEGSSSALPDDINELELTIQDYGKLLRVRITDVKKKRYEPQLPVLRLQHFERNDNEESLFHYEVTAQNRLVVKRKSTGAILFDADLSKLIFADKFIQLNSKLNSQFVYGLGEHYDTFLKTADRYRAYSFYNTDKLPLPGGRRSYGGFPFYINLDSDQQQHAHGVYLHNSNGMDIVLQADQSITFRPIGGMLDFLIFGGPTPQEVIRQYQYLIGLPDLPPLWSLGFHLCRYGYGSLEKTRLVWKRTRDSGIPFDIQWNDIDNMERHNDFTYDQDKFKGLPEFIDMLHANDMHYMMLFDPGLSQEDNYLPYSLGEEMDIFIKNATKQTLVGKVWNDSGRTVFPDFSNPKSIDYWTQLFAKFQETIKYDGAWIDMNDISSFVYGSLDGCPADNHLERPPYKPGGYDLQTNTLCLSARHHAGVEYDLHNLYAFYETVATYKALQVARPDKRPFVISRSTAPGQGHFGGHWSGDVLATWDYLKWSIPSLIEYSMYGFNMMGSDICGFTGNTNPELCARWSTLGAFYTFTRNHNDDKSIDQDPVALGPEVVEANRNALTKKYKLLPYLYTLIHRANKFGEPAIRSVPFEFYLTDREALKVEHQFMWGRGLMVSPVVDQDTYTKKTFLPKGRWYETNVLPTAKGAIKPNKWIDSAGEWYETKNISITDIPLFYHGGHILPMYADVRQTIAATVKQPFSLIIALDQHHQAKGELYIDDGDNVDGKFNHLNMRFENNKLTIKQDHDAYRPSIGFGQVKILGISSPINGIKVNGEPVSFVRQDHIVKFDLEDALVSSKQDLVVELS